MEAASARLYAELTPAPIEEIVDAVFEMFGSYASAMSASTETAAGVAEIYAKELARFPLWAVVNGIRRARRDSPKFAPSLEEISQLCEAVCKPYRAEIDKIMAVAQAVRAINKPATRDVEADARIAALVAKTIARVPADEGRPQDRVSTRDEAIADIDSGALKSRISAPLAISPQLRALMGWPAETRDREAAE